MAKTVVKIDVESPGNACDLLAEKSGLSKSRIKDVMNKGAVWLKGKRGGMKRLRRATTRLRKGSHIELYYDKDILSCTPPAAKCLEDRIAYSVWHKPAGLMSQGTKYGDHCSLLRQAELFFNPPREAFLVHRLDREVSGVMLIAHTARAAAELSALFLRNLIVKKYRAEVLGIIGETGERSTIELPLDGKAAVTEYRVLSSDPGKNTSAVEIIIKTGRLHQIRRHFDMIGYPVIGDPKYGQGNKNAEGMKLTAVSLEFLCPIDRKRVCFSLPG
ncbi:MAG: RluA family pseudouridine synthase [Nitrospiraceae bacterium]|nr:RluA family pseudouridine synthase [Nitrospiraceae bacterium]